MIRESISKNGEMIRIHYHQGKLKEEIVHELKPVFIGTMHTRSHGRVDNFIEPPQLIEHALITVHQDCGPGRFISQAAPECKAEDKFVWKLENV